MTVSCATISVDCLQNNEEDIKNGGPEYIGFDFYVKREKTQELMNFVLLVLERLEIPFEDLYVSDYLDVDEKYVFSKERILETIKNQAGMIKEEERKIKKQSF